jgi:hypothetical protein
MLLAFAEAFKPHSLLLDLSTHLTGIYVSAESGFAGFVSADSKDYSLKESLNRICNSKGRLAARSAAGLP